MADREIIQKLCLLGDAGTRKAELIRLLVYQMFDDKYIPTVGTKVTKKDLHFEVQVRGAPVPIRCTLLL